MKTVSLLVVEDHAEIQGLLCLWLKAHGYRVACAGSGNQAWKQLQESEFQLVITDVVMPDGDGVELISRLRKAKSSLGILAISGGSLHASSPTYLQLARSVGADALLLKPFKRDQLLTAVQHVLTLVERRNGVIEETTITSSDRPAEPDVVSLSPPARETGEKKRAAKEPL
jgi:CheY-like chemotaxis protein